MNEIQKWRKDNADFYDNTIGRGLSFWEVVEAIITYLYKDKYWSKTMKILHEEVKEERERYGKAKGSIRLVGTYPGALIMILDSVYGAAWPVNKKAFQNIFFKKYPQFKITDYKL
jgi:hypothetical protein